MDIDQLLASQYIKAGEFQGKDATLTIASVVLEELDGDGGKKMKGIVGFKETKKRWVLNRTNALCLKAMFGRETSAWVGKRVTLFPQPIDFVENSLAIRVRGSPDIANAVTFELKLPRKKGKPVTLARTTPGKRANPTPPHNPATGEVAAPPKVTSTGEPPPDVALPGDEPPPLGDGDFRGGP